MFTEQSPRNRSSLLTVLMRIAADQFWKLTQHITDQLAADAHPNGITPIANARFRLVGGMTCSSSIDVILNQANSIPICIARWPDAM